MSLPTLAELMASVQGTDDEAILESILFGSAYDMLDRFFESEQVKGVFAFSFNDAPIFFARLETARFGDPRYQGIVQGGMGGLPRAIEAAALSHGAHFETNAEVRRVLVENGSAIGVELVGWPPDPRRHRRLQPRPQAVLPEYSRRVTSAQGLPC